VRASFDFAARITMPKRELTIRLVIQRHATSSANTT